MPDKIQAALERIDGLAVKTGLRRFGGRADKYAALLRTYADAHDGDALSLRDLLVTGRHDEARQLAHAIKGASAMLGATGIQALAASLEKTLAEGAAAEDIERAAVAFLAARAALAEAILAAL